MPVVKLQSLDKITARSMTFEARVGSTVKFGPLYIKVQACQKAPPVEQPESAAFLQIWEVNAKEEAKWIFSGWMFSSSPALSYMDHPIYDVWVLDCLEQKTGEAPPPDQQAKEGEGEVPSNAVPAQPTIDGDDDGVIIPPKPETSTPSDTAPAPEATTPETTAPQAPAPSGPTSQNDGDLQMED